MEEKKHAPFFFFFFIIKGTPYSPFLPPPFHVEQAHCHSQKLGGFRRKLGRFRRKQGRFQRKMENLKGEIMELKWREAWRKIIQHIKAEEQFNFKMRIRKIWRFRIFRVTWSTTFKLYILQTQMALNDKKRRY